MAMPGCVRTRTEEKPPRLLVVRRARQANDYWTYCEEAGCEVWDTLFALSGRLGEPMGLWLPPNLRPEGTSIYVMGAEFPVGTSLALPEAFEEIELPAQTYLILQGPPYDEAVAGEAIGEAMAAFDLIPAPEGWQWSTTAPRYQLAPTGSRGYIEGRPIDRIPC